jgi:copper(I)-binding protein
MEKKMKPGLYLFVSMLLVGALNSPSAQSQEVKQGDLVISQPWSRAAPAGAELANGYLTIENKGTAADRLVSASTDAAEKIEIQKTSMSGGATMAEAVAGGLAIPAGEKVVLAPGAYKLALLKLKSKLKKGTKVAVTLEFEKAGKVEVPFEVLSAAAKGPAVAKDGGKMKK